MTKAVTESSMRLSNFNSRWYIPTSYIEQPKSEILHRNIIIILKGTKLFKFRKRKYSESDLFTRTIITISNYLHRCEEVKIEQTTLNKYKNSYIYRGAGGRFFPWMGVVYGCNRNNKTGAWEPSCPFQYIYKK